MLTLLCSSNRKSCMAFNLHLTIVTVALLRSCIFRHLQMVGLAPYILANAFTLQKDLVQQNSRQITDVLHVRFWGKNCWNLFFCCMQIGRWNDVSSTVLTLLLFRSKWSRTVLSHKAVWIDMFVRHEMYRNQTHGPRSANLHVDKVSSPTNIHIVKALDIHFQVKKIEVHSKVHEWLSRKTLTNRAKLQFTTLLVKYGFPIGIFIFDLDPF